MDKDTVKVYGYRWVVLAAFMFIAAVTQVLWITFAPITSRAAQFYGTSDLLIGVFSLSFMAIYVLIVIPSAWIIDTWGLRKAVGTGAAITAVCALTRGIFATNFSLVLISQIGIAIGQPLVIGSITKLAARWFPIEERATAAGLGTLALYIGILTGMVATPALTISYDINGMLLIYGIITVVSAITFFAVSRERPPTPPCPPGQDERVLMFDGLKSMIRQKDFILLLIIFFIGLGIFNGISTWIEAIVRPRGFSISQAGVLGGLMLIGGIIGAFLMSMISDKIQRRKPFIILALVGLLPGLFGITFATKYWLLLSSGFFFGFFLLSAGPIGFQYGAEITHPAPEGTSNSLLLVMGQISGIIIIFGMDAIKTASGSMSNSLLLLIGLTVVNLVLSILLRESPVGNTA
jgi:MFS family permease